MKLALTFLLTCFVLDSFAQAPDYDNHCIFFRKPKDPRLRAVTAGDKCIIGLQQPKKQVEGSIQRISFDTLFMNGEVIKLRDVAYIAFRDGVKGQILLTKPSDLPAEFVLFSQDTIIWKALIPPQSIFSSSWDYHEYVRHQQDSAKYGPRYHQGPKSPFMGLPRPGHH